MATGKLRQVSKSRFSDDIRERARKYMDEQKQMKERGVEAFPVKPPSKLKKRALSDAAFKTDLEDRMELQRGTLPRRSAKKGGSVKMAKGGSVSKRADGCAMKGKTKGRMI